MVVFIFFLFNSCQNLPAPAMNKKDGVVEKRDTTKKNPLGEYYAGRYDAVVIAVIPSIDLNGRTEYKLIMRIVNIDLIDSTNTYDEQKVGDTIHYNLPP